MTDDDVPRHAERTYGGASLLAEYLELPAVAQRSTVGRQVLGRLGASRDSVADSEAASGLGGGSSCTCAAVIGGERH